jgi:hypothetical protein
VIGIGAIWYAATQAGEVGDDRFSSDGLGGAGGPRLVALSVTGASGPLVAVVGGGPEPAFAVLPADLQVLVPGQGEALVREIASLPADSMRVAVSNLMGGWVDHYAELDLGGLGRIVDRAGGIEVRLADAVAVGSRVLGPGETDMDGRTVVDFLFTSPPGQVPGRFGLVLTGLFADPPPVRQGDVAATDDAAALSRALTQARGARSQRAPTQRIEGRLTVPAQPEFDRWVGERFGLPTPIRVIVQNGAGEPGIGEAVARLLLPSGFRVVLSGNAESFDHPRTDVIAEGPEHVDAAREARRLLGVGRISLSQVPSGVGDITIVVGKDFKA